MPNDILNTFLFQVALCRAYIRIAKSCPPHIWKPESLVYTLAHPEPCIPLIDCFRAALSILGPDRVGGKMTNCRQQNEIIVGDISIRNSRVGEKRPAHDEEAFISKRKRVDEETSAQMVQNRVNIVSNESEEDYANHMHTSLLSFVELLRPPNVHPNSLRPAVALTALSMLCITFCRYPETNTAQKIFQHMFSWIPYTLEEVFWILIP